MWRKRQTSITIGINISCVCSDYSVTSRVKSKIDLLSKKRILKQWKIGKTFQLKRNNDAVACRLPVDGCEFIIKQSPFVIRNIREKHCKKV